TPRAHTRRACGGSRPLLGSVHADVACPSEPPPKYPAPGAIAACGRCERRVFLPGRGPADAAGAATALADDQLHREYDVRVTLAGADLGVKDVESHRAQLLHRLADRRQRRVGMAGGRERVKSCDRDAWWTRDAWT